MVQQDNQGSSFSGAPPSVLDKLKASPVGKFTDAITDPNGVVAKGIGMVTNPVDNVIKPAVTGAFNAATGNAFNEDAPPAPAAPGPQSQMVGLPGAQPTPTTPAQPTAAPAQVAKGPGDSMRTPAQIERDSNSIEVSDEAAARQKLGVEQDTNKQLAGDAQSKQEQLQNADADAASKRFDDAQERAFRIHQLDVLGQQRTEDARKLAATPEYIRSQMTTRAENRSLPVYRLRFRSHRPCGRGFRPLPTEARRGGRQTEGTT